MWIVAGLHIKYFQYNLPVAGMYLKRGMGFPPQFTTCPQIVGKSRGRPFMFGKIVNRICIKAPPPLSVQTPIFIDINSYLKIGNLDTILLYVWTYLVQCVKLTFFRTYNFFVIFSIAYSIDISFNIAMCIAFGHKIIIQVIVYNRSRQRGDLNLDGGTDFGPQVALLWATWFFLELLRPACPVLFRFHNLPHELL